MTLLDHHRAGLRARGLADLTITAAGLDSETSKDKLAALLGWKRPNKTLAPAIVIPFHGPDGVNGYCRVRPDVPRKDRNGKDVKYESPKGQPNRAYFPPGDFDYLTDPAQEIAITEGEFKALALTQELLPTIGLVGVFGWKAKDHQRLLPELERIAWNGRTVYIVFDSDYATNENVVNALAWLAKHLIDRGAKVRFVRLPDKNDGSKQGIDDYIAAMGPDAKREVRALLDAAEDPPAVDAESVKSLAETADPAKEAAAFLEQAKQDGKLRLRTYANESIYWTGGKYDPIPTSDMEAQLCVWLNRHLYMVKRSHVGNVLAQVKAQSVIYSRVQPPAWLGSDKRVFLPEETIVAKNGIVNLAAYVDGREHLLPATPDLFTFTALDYAFNPEAKPPARWLDFLNNQLWPDDAESVATLQEIAGYLLVHWTNLQKIFAVIGPRRAGKGVIARVLRSVIGENNVAAPTMGSLAGEYGLWALLNKSAAFIADARLGNRTDSAIVVERLLNISGEDCIDVPRKYLETLKAFKFPTRIALFSNELPSLHDSSGALSGRLIVLRLLNTFYGRENPRLTDELLQERDGILLWAIEGWARLRQRGYFVQPAAGQELADQMEEISSPIAMFVKEFCLVDSSYEITVADLYRGWRFWCDQKGRKAGNEQVFGRNLAAAYPQIQRARPRSDGSRYRAYQGIDLLPEIWQKVQSADVRSGATPQSWEDSRDF